ncbi:MAG: UDP-N-acetylmuramoyl-L-alanine--D-glutamate ligase [Clostridiales bacterium]|nr:UDP-N-acetylmuramoyl-L-alanine--D-glutamate ligase [Clostridiales bacterium]
MKKIEEYKKRIKDKKILVVGLGKSGKAATEVLNELGANVVVQDSATKEKIDDKFLKYLENNNIQGFYGTVPDELTSYDIIVLSPGVPTDLDFICEAKKAGVEVIGELELAYRLCNGRFIAITGTNGKTTTTTLVGEIFKASGRKTSVVGNIGNPVVSKAVNAGEDEWMIVEASSFQLETIKEFKPMVSSILNLKPDHLNRHKTMESYAKAKANIIVNQTKENFLIINYDDKECLKLADLSKAMVVPFSRKEKIEIGSYIDNNEIIVKDEKGESHMICKTSDLKIIGSHNLENSLAAAAISYFAGISPEVIGHAITEFPGVEHRIEFCGRVDGIDFYNDSKGTNVDAAMIALKALEKNIILIAGGDGKGQDFTALGKELKDHVIALILLGRDAPVIEKAARDAGFNNIFNCKDMSECIRKAYDLAREGDKILLSPACASWDMYENFEQRGRHFKDIVKDLLN